MFLAKDRATDLARRYWEAGINVVPLLSSAPLVPAINTWQHFFQRQATETALGRYATSDWVVGIVTGRISGGLEVLDFEHQEDWQVFREQVDQRQPGLLEGLPLAASTAGVTHLYYRCNDPHTALLAVQPLPQDPTLPELRVYAHGEASFIPAPENERGVENWRFQLVGQSSLASIRRVEDEERSLLHEVARSLDRSRELKPGCTTKLTSVSRLAEKSGVTVREDFVRRSTWEEVFRAAGWQLRFCRHDGSQYWADPESPVEVVDVLAGEQEEIFNFSRVASQSQHWPFRRRDWDRFESYAALIHEGDEGLAGRNLWELGFGSEPDTSWVDSRHGGLDVPARALTMTERMRLSLGSLWRLLRGSGRGLAALNTESGSPENPVCLSLDSGSDCPIPDNENGLSLLSSREIRFADLRSPYLVADLIVAGKLTCLSGVCHYQKNALMADLALSTAQGTSFLGTFEILRNARGVLFLVDEPVRAEMMDLCRQVAVSKGTDLRQVDRLYWSSESILDVLGSDADCRRAINRLVEGQVDLLLIGQSVLGNLTAGDDCWGQLERMAALSGAALVCSVPGGSKSHPGDTVLPASAVRMHVDAVSEQPESDIQQMRLSRKAAGCPAALWNLSLDQRNLSRPGKKTWKVRVQSKT